MATVKRRQVGFRWVSEDGVTVCASPSFVTFWRGRAGGVLLGGPFHVDQRPTCPADLEGLYREWVREGRLA